ncbi:MAG: LysM peptidoglycan-binding domain-containing protein [Candidatus Sericytochromatia bacterium]
MMADYIQAPQDDSLSFDSDGIEAELAFLQGVLEQAESALGAADLAEVPMLAVELAESGPRDRYRPAGPTMVKVAAIGLATFPAVLAPLPAFANEPLPQNMMLALAQRPEAPPALAATGAQLFPFSRPMLSLREQVSPAQKPAAAAQSVSAAKRFALNPKLKTLFTESRQVAVTTKRGAAATFYQVGKGDSLYSIAADLLGSGSRWRELYSANKTTVASSYLLKPGQRLVIPAHRGAKPVAPAPAHLATHKAQPINSPLPGKAGAYRVAAGDSLYTIAQKRLGSGERWREIVAMNKAALQGRTLIYPNQWLQLPTNAG